MVLIDCIVEGVVGKTTTKDLAVEVLGQRYPTLKNDGVLSGEIEIPLAIMRLTSAHQRAVYEISLDVLEAHPHLLALMAPRVALLTNLGTAQVWPSGERGVVAQLATLVRTLPDDGVAILNYDDPLIQQMAGETSARVLYYGLNAKADIWALRANIGCRKE